MMRRRDFITLLGGAAAAWPVAARAQPALPVIGWLGSETREAEEERVAPFREGLREAGYVEGQNVAIEGRWADGHNDRLPALAGDLVRRGVSVLAVIGVPPTLAAKAATATIPIVFQFAGDPVELGVVASLNRPGGNLTGMTSLNVEVVPKQLDLMHELVPTASVVALLVNPTNQVQAERTTRDVQAAAGKLGLRLHVLHAGAESDFDGVFATLDQLRASVLVVGPDSLFTSGQEQLGALAARHAVPAICPYRGFAAAGGLMSYGTDIPNQHRLLGGYAGRILKGEKPADLPVLQPTKFELIINMKAARALGLTVPLTRQVAADEVIE